MLLVAVFGWRLVNNNKEGLNGAGIGVHLRQDTGTLQALLETQHSVEVLGEHQLAGRLAQYPLIVIPEWDYLDAQFRIDLLAYVKAGGNLLLAGPGPAALFRKKP